MFSNNKIMIILSVVIKVVKIEIMVRSEEICIIVNREIIDFILYIYIYIYIKLFHFIRNRN